MEVVEVKNSGKIQKEMMEVKRRDGTRKRKGRERTEPNQERRRGVRESERREDVTRSIIGIETLRRSGGKEQEGKRRRE